MRNRSVNELVLENLSDENIIEIQKRYIEEQTKNKYLNWYHLIVEQGRDLAILFRL